MWTSESCTEVYLPLMQSLSEGKPPIKTFKRNAIFTKVVGTDNYFHVIQCFNLLKQHPDVYKNLDAFRKNDNLGAPMTATVDNVPTGFDTLRFAESVCYISSSFGDLTGKTIAEFGSNYGGLSFLMNTQWKVGTYHLIDLPEVQAFSTYYLGQMGISGSVLSTSDPSAPIDLFISEYALTQFTDDDLYAYWAKYGKNANGVFIRCNIMEPDRQKTFIDTVNLDFNTTIIDEPKSRLPNRIIVGTRKVST